MKLIEKYVNPDKVSFIILILPYLGIISIDQFLSPLSSILNTLVLLVFILVIDYLYKKLMPIINNFTLHAILRSFIICIFYGEIIIEKSLKLLTIIAPKISLNHWIIIVFTFCLIILIHKWLYPKHKEVIRFIKTFFIFFSLIMILYKINQNKSFFNIKSDYISISKSNIGDNDKPIILIITDGYISPDGFYKYYKDSSIYAFSNKLKNNGWIVNNNSKSEEITTVHSLSSLFNFNLKVENKKGVNSTFWEQKLIKSTLYDSLKIKQVNFYNLGMLDIGEAKRFIPIYYYYPTTFIGQFFDKSMINVKYIYNDSGLITKQNKHNQYILDTLPFVVMQKKGRSFFYAHLFMPHDPYEYFKEFTPKSIANPNLYFEYWNFTNYKLAALLNKLTKENKYRIIVTGDHGYGNIGGTFKAEDTFTAYYGFESKAIQQIKTVQDIGSLINGSFY